MYLAKTSTDSTKMSHKALGLGLYCTRAKGQWPAQLRTTITTMLRGIAVELISMA